MRMTFARWEKGKTMSDYIKREYAMELINKCVSHTSPKAKVMDFRHGEMNGLNWACDIIEAIPSADVAPVRHGRWEVIDAEEPRRYGCSECKRLSWHMENYCGNCGARMDGGDE